MNITKTLGVMLLAGIPFSQTGCSKQEDPTRTIPLVKYSIPYIAPNIHLFDRNKDEVLDRNEILDYINVAIDNGDGLLTYEEFTDFSHKFARLFSAETGPNNRGQTHNNYWQVRTEIAKELTDPIKPSIPLKEGNLKREKIESVLKELIEVEKLSVKKENVDWAIKATTLQGKDFQYLENDEKFRKAVEARLLRQKAVNSLMKSPTWIEKLYK